MACEIVSPPKGEALSLSDKRINFNTERKLASEKKRDGPATTPVRRHLRLPAERCDVRFLFVEKPRWELENLLVRGGLLQGVSVPGAGRGSGSGSGSGHQQGQGIRPRLRPLRRGGRLPVPQ